MSQTTSALVGWNPEQVAAGRLWVEAWKAAAPILDGLRREEIRRLDTFAAIAALCGPADYSQPPFAPVPTSGLIEQQRWFALLRSHD